MRDNIMFWPAVVLMVVEAVALAFLILEWRKAKRSQRRLEECAHSKTEDLNARIDETFDELKRRCEDES